jgi:hypothetical protein
MVPSLQSSAINTATDLIEIERDQKVQVALGGVMPLGSGAHS